jgi:hypothetical protein
MSNSVRDASLTTRLLRQRALYAYRLNSNFPVNNSARPEQPNTQTGDVPTDAKFGCTVATTSTAGFVAGYSFQYGRQGPGNGSGNF